MSQQQGLIDVISDCFYAGFNMSIRRQSREVALQVLFQLEFNPQLDLNVSFDYFATAFDRPTEALEYARFLVEGIQKNATRIDSIIHDNSKNWSLTRMSLVDKNILRVATFELHFAAADVPPKVAINEAIEIAKKYGGQDTPQFVNGLLDEMYNQIQKG
jgi:N utilization substance protein B